MGCEYKGLSEFDLFVLDVFYQRYSGLCEHCFNELIDDVMEVR